MSDYFDRIERHLLDAVDRNASMGTPRQPAQAGLQNVRPRRRSFNASIVFVAALVVVSVSVAVVFLTSLHATRRPFSGALPANQVCGAAGARLLSRGSPPESLLSILGVLRRPQNSHDRISSRLVPRELRSGSMQVRLRTVFSPRHDGRPPSVRVVYGVVYQYSRYVRRARVFAGGSDYLIPLAAVANTSRSGRCGHPYFAGLVLYEFRGGTGFGGGSGYTASEILAGHASSETGEGGRTILTFLVPDRVARVTVYFSAGQGAQRTFTTRPVGNVISVILPISSLREPFRVRSVWYSASGRVVKPIR
jgi:hypothetical protein